MWPMEEAGRAGEHDAAFYETQADAYGWGPGSATLDPERAALLAKWCVGRVLDVGCGPGLYVDHLMRNGHEAHGVDWSERFVAHASETYQGRFSVADARALPFGEGVFDTVMALDVLEHTDDRTVLAEMTRVLRARLDDARFYWNEDLVFTHHEDPSHRRYYDEPALRELLSGAGLAVEALEAVAPIDWNGLLLASIGFPSAWKRRWFFRFLFKGMKHAQVERYPSVWWGIGRVQRGRPQSVQPAQ